MKPPWRAMLRHRPALKLGNDEAVPSSLTSAITLL
jgi:hypothetical protein